MTRRPRTFLIPAVLATAGLLLTGCGSGSSSSGQVASLASASAGANAGAGASATPSPTSSADVEKAVLTYVECLRGQGLDVPDPSVDADGKLTFARPAGGGNGGTGSTAGGFDQDKLLAAQKVCGDVPAGITSALTGGDESEFQDAALKFAQCMRKQGVNVADPDFSKGLTGAAATMLQGLNQSDPKVAAAMNSCQKVFAGVLGGS